MVALGARLAVRVAERIKSSEEQITAGQGVFREAAILTVDVRGFTRLAQERPADEVIALLTEYQRRVVPVVQANQGVIDKFLGDGILATFGAAAPSSRPAAEALTAVAGILAAIDDWNQSREAAGQDPVRVGAAVATGRVLFGAVGDETRLEYTVIGDAVNLAAKLEKQTKAEGVRALTTLEAYERANAEGYRFSGKLDLRCRRPVEGVDAPVLESEELFTRKAGEEIVDQLYHFELHERRYALRPEFCAKFLIVLDDSVVNDCDFLPIIKVRVRIRLARHAVRRPSCVTDTQFPVNGRFIESRFQRRQFAEALDAVQPCVFDD